MSKLSKWENRVINQEKRKYLIISGVAFVIALLSIINYISVVSVIKYSVSANVIFIILMIYLYMAFKADKSNEIFSTWKIFIYSFFLFYVFQVFSTQFIDPLFFDYPYEYKTSEILLKSANIFILGSTAFFLGYKPTYRLRVKSYSPKFLINTLNSKKKIIISNYVLILIVITADLYNSYTYTGSFLGRITTNYSELKLGSLSLLLFLYPVFLTNTVYIFLRYKLDILNKFFLVIISILIIALQFAAGTRSFIFNFIIAAAYLYRYNNKKVDFKWGLKKVKVAIVILLVYISNVFMQIFRQNKDQVDMILDLNLADYLWKYDTFETYLIAIRHFPDIENYKYFYSVKNLLVWIVPRTFYENKSIAFGKYLAYLVWPSSTNVPSAYAGITFGEFYANFGIIGMMLSLMIIGFFSGLINQTLGENKELDARTLLYSYVLMGLYGFYRGDFTTKTIHLMVPFIFMNIIALFVSIFCKQNKLENR